MSYPVHLTMPPIPWVSLGIIRQVNAGTTAQRYEMLYEDGWGNPFWGPLLSFNDHFAKP